MLILKAANLSVPGIAHGFFGRQGGVSKGIYASLNCGPGSKDSRDDVMENRARATAALAPNAALVTLYQVHSAEAVTVTAPWPIPENPKADAMATDRPGIALGILTADCAPILLTDPKARIIGAAHAGWNGALAGVVESALAAMERLGAKPERIRAAIGPCISQGAYEVGPEFERRFVGADANNARFFARSPRAGHWQFDLPAYVAQRLKEASVESVEILDVCTYARGDEFFSYRRTTHRKEPDYGRELSAIMLEE
ncbi:MAG TPA: peptidoglycan editing factor PgeF [Micropepsaceae bacterium]|nr:peptidoglycan editing factor PgeF [Micropepsaceae bacterium]